MMNLKSILSKIAMAMMPFSILFIFTSCSLMHEDLDGCEQELRVRFKYDMNMLFADAFNGQVKSVTLHAYDENGALAYKETETTNTINANGGYMVLHNVKPGIYTLQAWAEGEEKKENSYIFTTSGDAANDMTRLDCKINRQARDITHDLTPLYHGLVRNADLNINGYGAKTVTVPLTKDTNIVRVVIQNASGKALAANDFAFAIDDDNSWLAFDNSNLKEDSITYHPWSQYDGAIDNNDGNKSNVSAVVAEMTTNRLFREKAPRLKVSNMHTGKTVFNIPLIDYSLLVKGNYNKAMSDQEYLDRQDEYNFVFFVDDNLNWLNAAIYVNSWRVVLQNTDI